MGLKEKIKSSPALKKLVLWLLIPKNEARPRFWLRLLRPILYPTGAGSIIRNSVRLDILPFNKFKLGRDSVIESFATINNGVGDVIIGERTFIGLSNVLIGPVKIANDVILAQHIVISGLNHNYENVLLPISKQGVSVKQVTIEENAWIGANAVITAGVTIGKHSIVAAGSVVTKNVPPYTIVGGNPAKPLKAYNHETKNWDRL